MTVLVEPRNTKSTHHISLSDGLRIIGLNACDSQGNANPLAIVRAPVVRTALKTATGETKYSDFEAPWSPISQDDWSGGRGLEDAEKDASRFFDAYCANTAYGSILIGPQVQYSTGYRLAENYVPGNVKFTVIQDLNNGYGRLVLASSTLTVSKLGILLKCKGIPANTLRISVFTNVNNAPGAELAYATQAVLSDTTSEWCIVTLNTTVAWTSGTYYWIVVTSAGGTEKNHWEVGTVEASAPSNDYMTTNDNVTWTATSRGLYFRLTETPATATLKLFQFRSMMYAIRNIDGSAPVLYKNGDRGVADSNSGALSSLIDATKSWTVNQWAGCRVLLLSGKGSEEKQGWRTIVSNTATSLTVTPAWQITHDTTTEYVIVGSNTWTEVTGHGLTVPVTDVCIVGNIAYFCQGDSVNLRRMQINGTSGAHEWAADGTNKAVFLCLENNTDVWRGLNSGGPQVSKATKVTTWGTDMTFGTAIKMSDDYGRITNMTEYDSVLWIMREGIVYYNNSGTITPVNLKEMRTVAEYTNGQAVLTHNVYLYFNVGSGWERYYNSALDDVGPNRDKGLPSDRKGTISCAVGYPGRYYIAMNAGSTGYSCVLENNGQGWHELYRAPLGEQITDMYFEDVPGDALNRLWIAQGADLVWLPFPSHTLDPRNDPLYLYAPEGCVTSGYFYAGLYDAVKFVRSVKVFSENLAEDVCEVEIEYQLDSSTEWTPLDSPYRLSPIDEVLINPSEVAGSCNGRRIRYRVHLFTADASKTPEVKGVVMEAITRVPIKYSYSVPYRLRDEGVDSAASLRDILEGWAESLTPLTMRCVHAAYDNKMVFLEATPSRPYMAMNEGYVENLTLIEV